MTEERIQYFVGCSANGEDAESLAVLEYTVRKHASMPVDIHWMKLSRDPNDFWYGEPGKGGWQTQSWATPFSGFRWGIPAHQNYKGKAIYTDSDFIWLDDIAKLWNQEFQSGKVVMAKGGDQGWRYCSCMWDCAAAEQYLLPIERLRSIEGSHQRMMGYFSGNRQVVQEFSGSWNCIDGENLKIEQIQALHYSDMGTQLHAKYAVPRLEKAGQKHWFDGQTRPHWRKDLQELFDKLLVEANDSEYSTSTYIPNQGYGNYVKQSQAGYGNAHQWSK